MFPCVVKMSLCSLENPDIDMIDPGSSRMLSVRSAI